MLQGMSGAVFAGVVSTTLVACAQPDLPSEQIGQTYSSEVAGLRSRLETVCTPEETDIVLEGLAILADASQREALSASQRAAIQSRDAAFSQRFEAVSPECRARLNELAGPSPFGTIS